MSEREGGKRKRDPDSTCRDKHWICYSLIMYSRYVLTITRRCVRHSRYLFLKDKRYFKQREMPIDVSMAVAPRRKIEYARYTRKTRQKRIWCRALESYFLFISERKVRSSHSRFRLSCTKVLCSCLSFKIRKAYLAFKYTSRI